MTKKDIVVADSLDLTVYDVIAEGIEEVRSMIQANVGTFDLNEFNLPRAINPSAKSTRWEIPGIGEESEAVSEVEGIIVFHKEARVYYDKPYEETGGTEPPVCSGAVDPVSNVFVGEGEPGGFCAKCAKSHFTKDSDGLTQKPECSLIKQLFVLRPGEILPTKFNAVGGNAGQVATYLLNLTVKGRMKFNHCVTALKISDDKYKNGQPWKKWNLRLVSPLPADVREQMDSYHKFLYPILSQMDVVADDVKTDEPF